MKDSKLPAKATNNPVPKNNGLYLPYLNPQSIDSSKQKNNRLNNKSMVEKTTDLLGVQDQFRVKFTSISQ